MAQGRAGVMATNLRYNESISNPVAIYDVVGVESSTFSAPKQRQARFLWGVGTSYQLNPKVALALDYQRVQGVGNTFAWTDSGNGKLNYSLISAGARFSCWRLMILGRGRHLGRAKSWRSPCRRAVSIALVA